MIPRSQRPPGHLAKRRFRRVQREVPIVCVDLLPRRPAQTGTLFEYLLIMRYDRRGDAAWNTLGGRVRIDEALDAAAARHLRETLGPRVRWRERDWGHPDLVAQYARGEGAGVPFDPVQHSVALNYVIDLDGPTQAGGEALRCEWFTPDRLPDDREFGFAQASVVRRLISGSGAAAAGDERDRAREQLQVGPQRPVGGV